MREIDFLFIGGIISKEDETEIIKKSKKGIQLAANNFQWSLINGFDYNLGSQVYIMNTMFLGSYPRNYDDCIIYKKNFSHVNGAKDINMGFINFTVIKQFVRPFGEKKMLKNWVNKDPQKIKIVFIYSLDPRFIRVVKLLKKYNPNIYICISVNDLPQHIMLGDSSIVKKIWKIVTQKRVMSSLKYIDGFMIVTEQIAENLGIENKPHVIIEALVDTSSEVSILKRESNEQNIKKIVYTGGLTAKYGLLNLINAFMQIKSEEYRLIICGDGETKDEIVKATIVDKRIEYLGVLPPSEVKKVQQSATVLVNPRQNNNDFTKYSFPIKTIEYLLTGVPVIGYKLSGIPQEYDEYIIYVEDEAIESLRDKIIEVCNLSQDMRINIGDKNRKFVLECKNHKIQTKKILNMIISNYNNRAKSY